MTTTTTLTTCCYEGCTHTATEYDTNGDLACPLHAAQSEAYVVVTDLTDGPWLDAPAAERAESLLSDAGWTVTIREPRGHGEAEGTYLRRRGGDLQILGYSIPTPEPLSTALDEAAAEALGI